MKAFTIAVFSLMLPFCIFVFDHELNADQVRADTSSVSGFFKVLPIVSYASGSLDSGFSLVGIDSYNIADTIDLSQSHK
jgi:hypothetical protein